MSENLTWHDHTVTSSQREKIKCHEGMLFWFTGLSASGKSTLANKLEHYLNESKVHTYLLDGDNLRSGLNKGLGFTPEGKNENIRRAAEVSRLFVDSGQVVISAFVSPLEQHRNLVREILDEKKCFIIYVSTSVEECKLRDPKGLYAKAIKGDISDFPGVNAPFEEALSADLTVSSDEFEKLLEFVNSKLK